MRILIVTSHFPWKGYGGGVRLYNTIKSLSKRHKITLMSVIEPDQEDLIKEITPYCEQIITINWKELERENLSSLLRKAFRNHFSSFYLLWGLLNGKSSNIPFGALKYQPHIFREKIRTVIENNKFDLIELNFPQMGLYGKDLPKEVVKVYSSHEVRTVNMYRFYKYEKRIRKKLFYFLQWKQMKAYEKSLLDMYDVVISFSPKDSRFFKEHANSNTLVAMIPTGVNLEYLTYANCSKRDPDTLVFLGYYLNYPNEDAVIYFTRRILPLTKKAFPDVKFYIIGSKPTQRVKDLADGKSIFVTGFVEDFRPYLQKATVFVVPMRLGGGIKGKIIEAMALGIPVVSTPEGCEGLEITDGVNIIIASGLEDFAQKTIALLKDKELQQRISLGGRKLAEGKYDWSKNFSELEKCYKYAYQTKRKKIGKYN